MVDTWPKLIQINLPYGCCPLFQENLDLFCKKKKEKGFVKRIRFGLM